LIERISKKDVVDHLSRKLTKEISTEEEMILDIFSYVNEKGSLGTYDQRSGKIDISLFNSKNLKEYMGTLMHEFTHKALSEMVPEITKKEISFSIVKELRQATGEIKGRKDMTDKERTQDLFFQNLVAINESLAYLAEKYYGSKKEPPYNFYLNKTHPGLFKRIYDQISVATEGKSLTAFDYFAARLYGSFANSWKEDMSQEDLKEIVISTMKEINKFKNES
jgi:hypothetical protein